MTDETKTDETKKETDAAPAEKLWVFRVRVRRAGRVFLYLATDNRAKVGDKCIVNTDRGMEVGTCVSTPQFCDDKNAQRVLSKIVRMASPRDLARHEENQDFERDAFKECHSMIENRKMPMKLVRVEATYDRKKVVFYFSAENRVDFRDLVKDLACKFRTRIELRQIGVRDEARLIGGLGVCGRPLCCATFLKEFAPVSIRMAKKQNLALNPSKISGLCGRLMCCILFEDDQYSQKCARKNKIASCEKCGGHEKTTEKTENAKETETTTEKTPAAKQTQQNGGRGRRGGGGGAGSAGSGASGGGGAGSAGSGASGGGGAGKRQGRQSRRRRGGQRKKRGNRVD